jgi:hypothetical protein
MKCASLLNYASQLNEYWGADRKHDDERTENHQAPHDCPEQDAGNIHSIAP